MSTGVQGDLCVRHPRRIKPSLFSASTCMNGFPLHVLFLQGWRVIFYIVGTFAFVSGILVVLGGIEPRSLERKSDEGEEAHGSAASGFWKGILTILNSVQRVFRIRSFQVILLVGIIETFHWVSHSIAKCGLTCTE